MLKRVARDPDLWAELNMLGIDVPTQSSGAMNGIGQSPSSPHTQPISLVD